MAASQQPHSRIGVRVAGTVFGVFLCLPLSSTGRNLEEALPVDSLGYFKINGLRRIVENTKEHPVVELWKDPELQRFLKPLLEEVEEEDFFNDITKELDMTPEEFLEYFPGQLVVALPSELPKDEEIPFEMLCLIEFNGSLGALREIHEFSAHFVESEEKYLETRLFLEKVTEGEEVRLVWGYALLDGIIVLASPIELLKETVARLVVGSSDGSLTHSRPYRKFKERVGVGDLEVYLNLEGLMKELSEQLLEEEKNAPANLFALSAQTVLDVLALDVLEALFLSVNLAADETAIDAGLLYAQKKGLIRLLAYREGKLARPGFVPKDALMAVVSLFSLREFWVNLEDLIFGSSPMWAAVYKGALEQIKVNIGIDLRSSLIDNISDEIVVYSGFAKGRGAEEDSGFEDLSSVVAVAIRDRKGFEMALEALKSTYGAGVELFDQREYLDTTIFTQKLQFGDGGEGGDTPGFSYVLTDRYFLIGVGSATFLEEAVVRLKVEGKSIWQNRDLASVMNRLGDDVVEVRYLDIGALLNTLFVALVNLQERIPKQGEDGNICDPSALPRNLEFPYFLLSSIYSEDTGLFGKSLLLKKSD